MDEDRRREIESFQDWCLRNYAEGTKSKTIRLHKYNRILASLRGEIPRSAESSKFRFWVKTKGFRLIDGLLYVPSSADGVLRRVAVVEDFYDIIYGLHVGGGARYGHHAGQKRTYRAVSERFAFLPREAVTRFLLGCSLCQRRLSDGETTSLGHLPATPLRAPRDTGGELAPINLTTRSCVIQLTVPREMRCSTPTHRGSPSMSSLTSSSSVELSPLNSPEEGVISIPRPSRRFIELRTSPELEPDDCNGTSKNGEIKDERDDWCYSVAKKARHDETDGQDETSSSGNKDEDEEEDDSDDLRSIPHDPERLKAFNMFVRLFVDENLDRIVPISKQPKEKINAIIDSCMRQFPEFGDRARKRIRTYLKSCRRNKKLNASYEPSRSTPAHLTSAAAEQILASACENEAHNAKRMRLGLEPIAQPMPLLSQSDTNGTEVLESSYSPGGLSAGGLITTEKSASAPTITDPSAAAAPPLVISAKPQQICLSATTTTTTNTTTSTTTSTTTTASQYHHNTNHNNTCTKTSSTTNTTLTGGAGLVSMSSGHHKETISHGVHHHTETPSCPQPARKNASNNCNSASFRLAQALTGGSPPEPTDLTIRPRLTHHEMNSVRRLVAGYRESAAFLLRSADELEQLLLQQ